MHNESTVLHLAHKLLIKLLYLDGVGLLLFAMQTVASNRKVMRCKRIFLCKMYNLTEVENRFGNSVLDVLFLLMEDKFLLVIVS